MPHPAVVVPILVFLLIVIVKFAMNLFCFLECKRYLAEYEEYATKSGWRLDERKPRIVHLFKRAGIKDATVPLVDPVGYGYLRTGDASVFDNITVAREDVVRHVLGMFHQAIGVYRDGMWQAINPLYWVETIVYLPRELIAFVGVSSDNAIVRGIQVIYWIASIVGVSLALIDRIR